MQYLPPCGLWEAAYMKGAVLGLSPPGRVSMLGLHETFSVLPLALEALRLLILSWLLYNVTTVIYNLYFHPLARFPGPRLAAASDCWQAYVEVIKEECLSKKLLDLHARYGMYMIAAPVTRQLTALRR